MPAEFPVTETLPLEFANKISVKTKPFANFCSNLRSQNFEQKHAMSVKKVLSPFAIPLEDHMPNNH